MPQKKNPDAAELIRGKSGRVFGDLINLLSLMKAQAHAYNRDNQEDKEAVFDATDTTLACVYIMSSMVTTMTINHTRLQSALAQGFTTATDLADYLVGQGIAFRDAHRIVGEVVQIAEKSGRTLEQLHEDELKNLHPALDKKAVETLSVEHSLQTKDIYGGTAPQQVRQQIKSAREYLKQAW